MEEFTDMLTPLPSVGRNARRFAGGARFGWALLVYKVRYWRWVLNYPRMLDLHNKPWKLDKESRKVIYDRWDAEWEAREPQRPARIERADDTASQISATDTEAPE